MDVLQYIVSLRGAAAAGAEVRGLAGEMDTLSAAQARVDVTGRRMGASAGRLGGFAGAAGKGAAAIAVTLGAVAFEAVKASTSFNHEMLKIRTDAGASSKELANMKVGVLELAKSGASMGQGPNSLAQGLYHLESLGIRGQRALDALKLASQEAAISGANLEQTTTALGAAMYTGIKGTGDLNQLMGTLNATVGAGNMRFQDLVDALGTGILPSAKVAGLSIQDVSAALAVLTDSGQNAASGAAQLATALHFLYAPGGKAKEALKSIGLEATSLAVDMHKPHGLFVALSDLRDHLKGLSDVQKAQVLNAILPGGRGRVLLTELTMLDRLQGKYKQINATAGGYHGAVAQQKQDPMTQLHTSVSEAQGHLVDLGNALTPILVPAVAKVVAAGGTLLGWLAKLPGAIKDVVHWFDSATGKSSAVGKAFSKIGDVASSIWKTITHAFSGIASEAKKVFSGSFGHDLGVIGTKLAQFAALMGRIFGPILRAVIRGFGDVVRGVFNVIGGIVKVLAGLLTGDFSKAWRGLKQIVGGVMTAIGGVIHQVLAVTVMPLFAALKGVLDGIGSAFSWLWHNVLAPVGSFLSSAFAPVLSAVKDLFQGIGDAIQWAVDKINALLGPLKDAANLISSLSSTLGSLSPFGGGASSAPFSISSAGLPPGGLPALVAGANPNAGTTGSPPILQTHAKRLGTSTVPRSLASGLQLNAHFTHPITIDGREIARVHRREVIKAMAAGA